MATQNIIQYLETSQYNALPSGGTVPVGIEAMNRRQMETFIAGAAIAANDLVALDFSQTADGDKGITVIKADSGSTNSICAIGFAINAAAAAGDTVDVTIAGIHEKANCKTGITKGKPLSISGVAGQADEYVAGDVVPIVAYATENEAANVATVFVIKQF
jgi:hypothetical protein